MYNRNDGRWESISGGSILVEIGGRVLAVVKTESNFQSKLDPKPSSLIDHNALVTRRKTILVAILFKEINVYYHY